MPKTKPAGTLALFDVPAAPDRPAPKRTATGGAPTWGRYRPKRSTKCDDCIAYLHEHNSHGPTPIAARFRRTAAGVARYLCGPHAQKWRDADKMPRFRGVSA